MSRGNYEAPGYGKIHEKNPVYSSFSERKFWDYTCYSPISFLLLRATLSSAFTQQGNLKSVAWWDKALNLESEGSQFRPH